MEGATLLALSLHQPPWPPQGPPDSGHTAARARRRNGDATASAGLAGRREGPGSGSREGADQCHCAKRSGPGPLVPTTSILPKRKLDGGGGALELDVGLGLGC